MYARYGSDEQVDRPGRLLRRAAGIGRTLLPAAISAVIASVAATAARLAGPLIVRRGVDAGITAGDVGTITRASLAYVLALVIGYFAGRWALWSVVSVGERFLRMMRVRVYRHLMNLDMDFYGRSKVGVLVSRMTSDVEALTAFANEGAISVITSLLTVIGVTIGLFIIDPGLALVVLALMPVLIGISVVFRTFADRAYRRVREHIGLVLATLQEGISGVRVVQAYTQEPRRTRQFVGVNEEYYRANIDAAKAISVYFPAVDLLRTLGAALVLLIGGRRVLDGTLSLGSLLAFLLYLNWFFEPIVQLSNVYNLLQGALAALGKLFGVLDTSPKMSEHPDAQSLPDGTGRLVFENVSFSYEPGARVLDGVTLEIPGGQRVAVVGETGAGKSTLAKLAVRFYDPDSGRVLLDGMDLRDATIPSLREAVALVPQEGYLFPGSIRENIAYARPDMSDDEVWEVARTLGIDDWIRGLPERLDTQVMERGSRLSSGERQLLSLARALAADPRVIVLDEATSNLDPESEARVERALSALLAGRTAIVIAHRLQTAERADRVLVVAGGRVVEDGPYSDLVAAGGEFADLERTWAVAEGRIS